MNKEVLQEIIKNMLSKLDTMLEFDDGIAVDSVEELKTKYNEFVEKFYCEFRDCDVTYRKTCKNCIVASADKDENFYCPYHKNSVI